MARKDSGSDRFEYLQNLVTEFQDTDCEGKMAWMSIILGMIKRSLPKLLIFVLLYDIEAKEQVLANLANFAYDPRNLEDLKRLQVTELFLDMLTEENENFVEFGIGEHQFISMLVMTLPLTVPVVSDIGSGHTLNVLK